MATLLCYMGDCIHRSKRPSKKYMDSAGTPCYGCARPYAVVSRVFDPDGDIQAVAGKENTAICMHYEPKEKQEAEPAYLDDEEGPIDGA